MSPTKATLCVFCTQLLLLSISLSANVMVLLRAGIAQATMALTRMQIVSSRELDVALRTAGSDAESVIN